MPITTAIGKSETGGSPIFSETGINVFRTSNKDLSTKILQATTCSKST